MAIVFVVRAFHLNEAELLKLRFYRLPIRIGRNALADFQLRQSYISDFHAVIEDIDGRLCVRDLNSKNGVYTYAPGSQLPVRLGPQAVVDLSTCNFQFFLGAQIGVAIEFEQGAAPASTRASSASGSVLGNPAFNDSGRLSGPPPGGAPPVDPWALPLPAAGSPPGAPGWDAPGQRQPGRPGSPLPLPNGVPGGAGPNSLPPLGSSGFSAAPAPSGWSPEAPKQGLAHTGALNLSLDSMALIGLRELAGSLLPGRALNTTGDVARFLTKLHDAIEVFCRCFIPLREGYSQFVSSLDLQKASMRRSMMRSPSYMAVEAATDPAAVAAALLDWRDKSMEGPKAIEGIFADLMIHQVALLDGVMQGVRGLLEQLSPDNIEQQTGPQGPFAFDRSKARYKALWETYCARFEELAEEKQAFAHIFGPEFTQAYREYRKQRQE
ncbi:MAG TPA: type VI secretion system-associated FHA domain protein [Polyangiaceae bacterium]|nr:type VI secretion system-associated FHA domain protein [Polyangiaceae bacterium]